MYISHLSLVDFRSYPVVDVELDPGVNAFVGQNGQGKTNLVEAVGYLATLGSHRVSGDAALVRAGASRAVVRARVVRGDRAQTVELEVSPGKANRARINRGAAVRARDVLGIVRTVLFAPEDLALVKGDPDGRRRLLDDLAVLLLPRSAALLSDYDRVLRQRNALLKSAGAATRGRRRPSSEGDAAPDLRTLDVWDARLAELGGRVLALRAELVAALQPYVATAYEEVSGGQGRAEIAYRSSVEGAEQDQAAPPSSAAELEARMLEALTQVRPKEVERGVSLVGPHRDDLVLTLGGLPAKGYASHGESWSFALALRIASFRVMTQGVPDDLVLLAGASDWGPGGEPILVLDDVFAELDAARRDRLATLVEDAGQVLITAAVAEDVPPSLGGVTFRVQQGSVTRE
ncbi:DNA replication and repair protein RecF [Sediminihabitans luteus]|uniref:DNA replication and repair protein RecF n=1 Tax=Sediminihabitans luteus TaxID=1138585 RepID=A0A2M9CCR3_9CELL|nr:DNA replication/repair protein RecF [Sediminihabitans luteus]PJJ69150.1 DNA replication and repair protein RecF [Sediminihabitans luteus]GII98822.1 DNA replication and repair protein RecF [Sediminihabitans luteus]